MENPAHAGFTPRVGHGTIVFNNKFWVISGVIDAKDPIDIVWDVSLSSVLPPEKMNELPDTSAHEHSLSPAASKAGGSTFMTFVVILTAMGLCVIWFKRKR